MKIINKYILKQLIVSFSLVLLGLTMLIWLTQSLRMIDMIVTKGVSVRIFLEMTLLALPNFIQILSPLALFAVILFIFSRMQADKELMVMQAIGMSNRQIMYPVIGLAVVLTIVGYVMTLVLIPESYTKLNEMKWKVRNDLSHLLLQEGQFNSFDNGLTLYIKERLGDGSVRGVMAYDAKDPKKITSLVAEKGLMFQDKDGFQLVFNKGTRQEFNPDTKEFSILKFDKYTMWFSDKKNVGETRNVNAAEYSLEYLINAKPSDAPTPAMYRKYKVEILKRLTKPLYNITFAFLAMFGILAPFYNRRGQVGRINFVVLCALLIQSLNLGFENLAAKNLVFSPLLFVNVLLPILLIYLSMIRRFQFKKIFSKITVIPVLLIGSLLVSAPVMAQIKVDPQVKIEKDKPVDFEADTFSYDKNNDVLTAEGDVVIAQNGTIVRTEKFYFYRKTNQIIMPGEVIIETPDGTVTRTQNVILSADMNDIIGEAIVMRLYEGSLLTSERLKRTDEAQSLYLKRVSYSPCSTCGTEAPLWKISARNWKHDVPEKEMIFTHSFFEVKDVPVFYFPYLNVPDFTVKRKTGFLAPSLSHGSEMKQGVTLPFFVDLADNQNLTITPTFSLSHDPLGIFEYDGRFDKASFQLAGSGTRDDDGTNQGHIKANLRYDLNNEWRLSGQYYRTSSDTYFRRYNLPDVNTSQAYLRSFITAERFGTQNYFNFTGLSFQSLWSRVNQESIPVFIPTMDYHFTTDPLTDNGLYAFSNANAAIYNNRERFKSQRVSFKQGVALPYITPFGADMDFRASVRGDAYAIDTGKYGVLDRPSDETYNTGRVFPIASAKISYPLARHTENTTQVLEPILMLITSPTSAQNDKIPNIDSTDVDFDDTNLFSENRFVGYDRVETGTRANYGVQWSVFDTKNRSFSFLFGQSYRFSGDEEMDVITGTENNYSDYVGRLQMNYHLLTMAYRFRLDQETFEPKKNEITVVAGQAPLRLGVSYTQLKAISLADTFYNEREEILFFGSSRLSKKWNLSGYYRYNMAQEDKGPIEYGSLLQYDNDCTAIVFDLSRSFTEDRDYKGDTSFTVKFVLKTLGQM